MIKIVVQIYSNFPIESQEAVCTVLGGGGGVVLQSVRYLLDTNHIHWLNPTSSTPGNTGLTVVIVARG